MRIRMTYRIPDAQGNLGAPLQDIINWPDVSDIQEVKPHVATYLDQKFGAGVYILDGIEEVI